MAITFSVGTFRLVQVDSDQIQRIAKLQFRDVGLLQLYD